MLKYVIFKTSWGYFGLAGEKNKLLRTVLPLRNFRRVKELLLRDLPNARIDKNFCKSIQKLVLGYFEGQRIDFSSVKVELSNFPHFTRKVLLACRDIRYGRTISYADLAEKISNSGSARAVANALAKNPLALIIPCHRVICSNGSLGGFSAPGGVKMKEKLLKSEWKIFKNV